MKTSALRMALLSFCLFMVGCGTKSSPPKDTTQAAQSPGASADDEKDDSSNPVPWFDIDAPRDALQGSWEWGVETLTVKGNKATVTDKDGKVKTYTLDFEKPSLVYFRTENAGRGYDLGFDEKDVYLSSGTIGMLHKGKIYSVPLFNALITYDITTKVCSHIEQKFKFVGFEWGATTTVECAMVEKDGKTVFNYSFPKQEDGKVVMEQDSLEVVGSFLLNHQSKGSKLKRISK